MLRLTFQTTAARPSAGFFLCAEPDEAFFSPAVFELGSNPVKATGHFHPIRSVGIAMEALKNKHPLIRAEMDGLSGCRVCHRWVACLSFESSVRFYQWSQALGGSAPINTNLPTLKTKNGFNVQ